MLRTPGGRWQHREETNSDIKISITPRAVGIHGRQVPPAHEDAGGLHEEVTFIGALKRRGGTCLMETGGWRVGFERRG